MSEVKELALYQSVLDTVGKEHTALFSEYVRRVILNGTRIDANGMVSFGTVDFGTVSVAAFSTDRLTANTINVGTLNVSNTVPTLNVVNFTANTLTGNGAALTSVNAALLNGQPDSYFTNASNLLTGTLPVARLPLANTLAAGAVSPVDQAFAGVKTFTANTEFGGAANVAGKLAVAGLATLSGNTSIGGFANVAGALQVTGVATLSANVAMGASANVAGPLGVAGNTAVSGTLSVTGNTALANAAISTRLFIPVGSGLY